MDEIVKVALTAVSPYRIPGHAQSVSIMDCTSSPYVRTTPQYM